MKVPKSCSYDPKQIAYARRFAKRRHEARKIIGCYDDYSDDQFLGRALRWLMEQNGIVVAGGPEMRKPTHIISWLSTDRKSQACGKSTEDIDEAMIECVLAVAKEQKRGN